MIDRYEKLQKHDNEVRKILRDSGHIDSKGRIRRWSSEVNNALKEAGHDTLSPTRCQCQKE